MNKTYTLLVLACWLAALGSCQFLSEIKRGRCNPDLYHSSVVDFDPQRYAGRWYESLRTENTFEAGRECTTVLYTPRDDGSIRVETGQINPDGSRFTSFAEATIAYPEDPEHHGVWNVTVDGAIDIPFLQMYPNYRIMATDYDSYSLIWHCVPISALLKAGKFFCKKQIV